MSTGLYTFRAEKFTLDQQASAINDSLYLVIITKINDSVPQVSLTAEIAYQCYSGSTIDIGRWGETPPIAVPPTATISVSYLVLNITGGQVGGSGALDNVLDTLTNAVVPAVAAATGEIELEVAAVIVSNTLKALFDTAPPPSCSGLVHFNTDILIGAGLATMTENYAVHRVADKPSEPLKPPGDGCYTPASRMSIAVEQVPPRLAAAGPAKSSDKSIVITRKMPLGSMTAYAFNPSNPDKFVEPAREFPEPTVGSISMAAPGGLDDKVTPVHCVAIALSNSAILHTSRDGTGWHDWQPATRMTFSNAVALPGPDSAEIFAIETPQYVLVQSELRSDGTLGTLSSGPANVDDLPNQYQWGNLQLVGVTQPDSFLVTAGVLPYGNEMLWGTRLTGGLIRSATFKNPDSWSQIGFYSDQDYPGFMVLGPEAYAFASGGWAFAIGHDYQVWSSLNSDITATDMPPPGSEQDVENPYGAGFVGSINVIRLNTPKAREIAAAFNTKTNVVWLAFLGLDQQMWVGQFAPTAQLRIVPAMTHISNVGGPFVGRPVILPDPSGATKRTFFFVLGLEGNVLWKYHDGDTGQFVPPRSQWAMLPTSTGMVTIVGQNDPGPAVEDGGDPAANQQLGNLPILTVSDTPVAPGTKITVVGQAFPLQTETQLVLRWANTSSGSPSGAQIKFEIKGENTATPIDVSKPANFNGWYSYLAKALTPDKDYEFWARCSSDTVVWSDWSSSPLSVSTSSIKNVQLLLKPQTGSTPSVVLGSADLSPTSSRWQLNATIPQTTAPGNYLLVAQLGSEALASTKTAVATKLLPLLHVIDPATNQIIAPPQLFGGDKFTVRGENFSNGAVSIGINGTKAATTTAASGQFVVALTVPGSTNSNSQEITVKASGGGASASLEFETQSMPK
jgi:hypothetical protein